MVKKFCLISFSLILLSYPKTVFSQGLDDLTLLEIDFVAHGSPCRGLIIVNRESSKGIVRIKHWAGITEMDVKVIYSDDTALLKCSTHREANTNKPDTEYIPDNFYVYPNNTMENIDNSGYKMSVNYAIVDTPEKFRKVALDLKWHQFFD